MTPEERCKITAYHESAHAVVNYRCAGHSGGRISIVPRPKDGVLGSSEDGVSDGSSAADMEARILSCYAGGHAQRELAPDMGDGGCEDDEKIAADLVRQFGWESREQELRDRSLTLTRQHWPEVAAVAEELLRCRVLDDTELEIIADGATGDTEASADLQRYRELREWSKARLRGPNN